MKSRRILSMILAIVMVITVFPATVFAVDDHDNMVRVIIENSTYSVEDGAPWDGVLVDEWVKIDSASTMMSCVVTALEDKGYTQTGAENNYLSEINGLSEFDGGYMSGWMGTLNDWFTNEGFGAYTVANGTFGEGDEVHIMYTCAYGDDLGGSWSNTDSWIDGIEFSTGKLDQEFTPEYTAETGNYTLTLPEGTVGITVRPTAANKNYMTRIFLNQYEEEAETHYGDWEYKRNDVIPVKNGDVIYVGCGLEKWPSMNSSDGGYMYSFQIVIPTHSHSWSDWEVTTAATCTEKGTETRDCECGETETREISVLDHNYVDGVCSRCGDVVIGAPIALEASNDSTSGSPKLSWDAVDGAVKYYVYRSTKSGSGYKYIGTAKTTSYTDKTAEAGTKYYYRVRSVNVDGVKSAPSNVKARTCDCAKPVVTASNTASTGKVKLSWDKVAGAEKYYVYRATSKSGDYSKIGSTTSTSYTDKTAKEGKQYYYKVKAICENTSANSVNSTAVARTCDCARPDVSIKLSNGQPKLSWDKVTGAEKYYVYRATIKDGDYSKIGSTTSASYTDKTAKSGKTYYYKVKAINSNSSANSAYSSVDSIKVK